LEINLIAFIALCSLKTRKFGIECAIKYFVLQAFGTTILICYFIVRSLPLWMPIISLLLKLGAFPLHYWVVEVAQGIEKKAAVLLLTWQKLSPFFILSHISVWVGGISLIGASFTPLLTFSQISPVKIIAYSSIYHIS